MSVSHQQESEEVTDGNTDMRFLLLSSKGKTRALTERQRERFSQLQINCVEYRGLNEEFERDMFQRVQMGITLTPAEKVSASACFYLPDCRYSYRPHSPYSTHLFLPLPLSSRQTLDNGQISSEN